MIPALSVPHLPAMSDEAVAKVRELEKHNATLPQVEIATQHIIHGGLYARTIRLPAGVLLTGALLKIPTLLILNGHVTAYIGGETLELCGYHVLPGSAGRKQAFLAQADTVMTMLFPTQAKCVEDAENEFTDEADKLFSRARADQDETIITGE